MCPVAKKLDVAHDGQVLIIADEGRLLIVVIWIARPELDALESPSRSEVPFLKKCRIYFLIKNRK
jgi:hypothetical protein